MTELTPYQHSYEYIIPDDYEGTVEDFLRKRYNFSGKVITSVVQEGYLTKNGEFSLFKGQCRPGDRIVISLKGEYPDCEGCDGDIDVIYEDEDVLVIDKPPYMVVHPTKSHFSGTLSNYIYGMWGKRGYVSKVHMVSRLDMNTSGVIVMAKNKYVHHCLQSWNQANPGNKYYIAITQGCPKEEKGLIDAPIIKLPDGIKRAIDPAGQESRTEYELVERIKLGSEYSYLSEDGYLGVIKLRLLTGRTHQIRAHLKHIGLSIIGDELYGGDMSVIHRQALHCVENTVFHPRYQKLMSFTSSLPGDITDMIDTVKARQ